MTTVVFQKGETTFGSATGFNTPTNPLVESNSSFTDSERLFTLIYPDDSTSSETFVEVGASSANTLRYNLENTKGFRIKCFNSVTSTGIQLTGGNYDSDYYYFVLVHSDNHLKHHFAKVTDIITEDVVGDAFEFTPPLGKEIPKDTEFMVFKGPIKTTKAIAFSAGIKNDLKAALVVSSPLFFMLDSSLNKKGQLDHNTKYHLRLQKTDGVTTTVDSLSEERVFVTEQHFSNKILDYSKYTMQLTLTDNLKTLDASNTSNEGNSVLNDPTNYDKAFPNARRDSDDKVVGTSTILTQGPIRYLHYNYSPTKVNVLGNVLDNKLEQSIGNRGGYCETKILNPSRVLTTKITEFDKYRVRHRVFTGQLNDFVDMKVTLGSHISSRQYNIVTDYSDVRDFINVGDEILIDGRIVICSAITTTTITFEEYSRLETESVFTTSTSLTSLTGTLQRRAYNYQDNTILTTFNLLDGRTDELYVKTQSKDMESLESTVTTVDATHGLITLSSNSQSYSGDSSLRYSLGSYSIEVERFTGTIEKISSYKEDSQNFVELNGRSDISKLFGPIINKDTAFSEDIIYSTLSPYNTLGNIKSGNTYSVALGATEIDTGITASASSFDNYPVAGTRLFGVNGYIGEVLALSFHASVNRKLIITPAITKLHSEAIYMETDKNYMFNKALGSSHLTTVNPTSLTGSAGKGVYFTSGKEINAITKSATTASSSTTVTVSDTSDLKVGMVIKGHAFIPTSPLTTIVSIDTPTTITISANATAAYAQDTLFFGLEGNDLVGSSINTNPKAIGYHINSPISINNDNAFQAKFKDEIGSEANSSFDTVNTLIDFEIVNVNSKDSITEIELAPYIPITLGRKMPKFSNNDDSSTATAIGVLAARSGFTALNNVITAKNILINNTTSLAFINAKIGQPVYRLESNSYIFMGILRLINYKKTYGNNNTVLFHLDRDAEYDAGITIYHLETKIQEIGFTNGKHLWGGKIISSPHPKITSTGVVPLNHVNPHSTNEDIFKKFGQPYYRLNSLALGNFNYFNARAGIPIATSTYHQINTYGERSSKINYLSEVYQFKPKTASSNITLRGKTNTTDKHWPYDERGKVSVFGSNFSDTIFHTNSIKTRTIPFVNLNPVNMTNEFIHRKNALENTDNSALRLFLYINSDILPYSSLRKDSIFNGSKGLNNYNLLLLQDNSIKDNSINDNSGDRIKLQDINFETISISSSDFSNTSKRVGMMRLTEMCFDYLFNSFNPEKEISTEEDADSSTKAFIVYRTMSYTDLGTINVSSTTTQHAGGNEDEIVFSSSVSLAQNDIIVDSRGNMLGSASATASSTTHTLNANVIYTGEDGELATDNIFKVTQRELLYPQPIVKGTSLFGTRQCNLIKKHNGAVIPSLSQYGKTQGVAYTKAGNADISLPSGSEILLPIVDDKVGSSILSSSAESSPARVLGGLITNISNSYYKGTMAVALYRYDVEDGGKYKLEKGNVSDVLTTVDNMEFNGKEYFTIKSNSHFKDFAHSTDTSADTHADSIPFVADGIGLGFKCRLWISSSSRTTNSTLKSSNGDIRKNVLDASNANAFLEFVDLTGCYLVMEKDSVEGDTGSQTTVAFMNEVIPEDIVYVISHEIDSSNHNNHVILTDKELTNDRAYRLMQPNEVCMYDFTPEDIVFNKLSSRYTKVSDEDSTYSNKSTYLYQNGIADLRQNEGFLSMYVLLDTDKQTTDDYVVIRDNEKIYTEIFPTGNTFSLYASDGDNKTKLSFSANAKQDFTKKYFSTFSKTFFCKGIVSLSETFTVQTFGNLKITPTRACIGTTATIANETEDLINELLEENNIEFEMTNDDYPLFLAPNYQGVDLFSAINYLLEQKDMTLFEENEVFKIKNKNDAAFYKGIILNETGKYQIYDFEETKNMFDFYNKITVYGRNHKSTRKRLRSINEKGLKALEVFEDKLTTQEDVNKEASKLLRLHSEQNKKIKVTIGHENISQLKVGDIIALELPRENIPLIRVIVLQVNYLLTGLMELELGRYSKGMEDIFAELLIDNKKINSKVRNQSFKESESLDFLDDMKIKGLRVLIRKKSFPTTGFPLGFSTPLNTGTSPLGLSSGSITYTTLLDEELI
jgi:hypothetical protein